MEEHHVEVTRTARYCQLGYFSNATKQIWLVCHGYGQLASYFIKHFSPIDDGDRVVVAPEALSRFYLQGFSGHVGASWMTREDRSNEIHDYIKYLDAVWQQVTRGGTTHSLETVVMGFSQGTATAARWAARGRVQVHRLILWAGELPPDLTEHDFTKLHEIEIVQVVGNADPIASEEFLTKQKKAAEKHNLRFRMVKFDGGHELDAETLGTLV